MDQNNKFENLSQNIGNTETEKLNINTIETQQNQVPQPNISNNLEQTPNQTKEIIDNNLDKINESQINPSSQNTSPSKQKDVETKIQEDLSHMTDEDLEFKKTIDSILDSGLESVYESLDEKEKEKYNENKHNASIKIIATIKSTGKNVKKAIKYIFKIIYDFINSLKSVKNPAFIDKATKIKVDKIIYSINNDKFTKK